MLTHGANPGIVSHFVKEALLDIARDTGVEADVPTNRARAGRRSPGGWRSRSSTSPSATPRWRCSRSASASSSTPGRSTASSARAASRRNWAGAPTSGTSRRMARRHDFGCGAAIYLERPGAGTRVRTWTPLEGPFHGFLVTHNEFDLDRRLLHRAERPRRRLPADGALRLPPVRRRGAVAARARRQELAAAAGEAADDGRDRRPASTSSACC